MKALFEDCEQLEQNVLGKMINWSTQWSLKVYPEKCLVWAHRKDQRKLKVFKENPPGLTNLIYEERHINLV